jgi:hypothetical protein
MEKINEVLSIANFLRDRGLSYCDFKVFAAGVEYVLPETQQPETSGDGLQNLMDCLLWELKNRIVDGSMMSGLNIPKNQKCNSNGSKDNLYSVEIDVFPRLTAFIYVYRLDNVYIQFLENNIYLTNAERKKLWEHLNMYLEIINNNVYWKDSLFEPVTVKFHNVVDSSSPSDEAKA